MPGQGFLSQEMPKNQIYNSVHYSVRKLSKDRNLCVSRSIKHVGRTQRITMRSLATVRAAIDLGVTRVGQWVGHLQQDVNLHAGRLNAQAGMNEFALLREISVPTPHMLTSRRDMPVYHLAHAQTHPATPLVGADAKAVVLALGGTGTGRSGVGMMRLAGSFRDLRTDLVSFDHPFHGPGIRDMRAVDYGFYFDRVNGILDELEGTGLPLFLLGHSFGSIVIQEMLLRYNRNLSGAMMVSPAGFQSSALLEHYLAFRHSPAWDEFTADNDIQWDTVAEVWGEGKNGNGGMGGLFQSVAHSGRIDTSTPVWLVAGTEDPWNTESLAQEIADRFERSRLIMVEGAGHTQVLTMKKHKKKKTMIALLFEEFAGHQGVELSFSKRAKRDASMIIALNDRSPLFREWMAARGVALDDIVSDDKLAKVTKKDWATYYQFELVPGLARNRFKAERDYMSALRSGAAGNPVSTTPWSPNGKLSHRRSSHISIGAHSLQECDAATRQRAIEASRSLEALLVKESSELSQGEAALLERFVTSGLEVHHPSGRRIHLTMDERYDVVASF